ncbi:hypothetical protein [Pseudoclavibacter sp. CFCC 11306]|uniref:hypothetical protein n=1 Tax=Pseudoclavibacter sp. CFCC 11306 TaxID=1564493 RepID=UPI001301068D|nr:hypothetical protein [Pseudoclavibacter sp. CFCC 11306]KAB1658144.1 hypothetical protein F8O09_00470 [Pseudoclavibacter sp. CFCC 11306]
MNDDQFDKLWNHFEQRFNELNERLDIRTGRLGDKIDGIYNHPDALRETLDTDEVERGALADEVERHENWIERAAPQIGVTYDASA